MTTTKEVRAEISRFLESSTPEVLCITGKWGVGKTFSWHQDLVQAQEAGNFALNRYSYVSLFGLNSLEDLRYAVFENTVAADQIAKGPDANSLKTSLHWVEKHGRKLSYWLNAIPYAKELLSGSKSAFFFVREQLVCIDDLERHGKDLDVKDVLGLASYLKEQRKCKVVILLNEEQFSDQSRSDFNSQLEKVVDTRLTFDPTSQEAIEIGLSKGSAAEAQLRQNCLTLGIKNIRVIKKLERAALRLEELLRGYDERVLRQAVHTATLFGWAMYQPKDAPTVDFIKKHNSIVFSMTREKDSTEQEKAWHALLSAYGFGSVDGLDAVIIAGVENGFFDPAALEREAKALQKTVESERRDASFSKAWDLFHDSFSTPAEVVLDNMAAAVRSAVDTITPLNLSGTISLFKELGRPEQARELLEFYMTHRSEDRAFYDLENNPFGSDIADPDVRAAFASKLETFVDNRDPKQILIDIVLKSGWNPEDVALISKLTVEDFKKLFLENSGVDLRRMIQAALQFGNMGGVEPGAAEMAKRAAEALRQIGEQSEINARRVRKYGIVVSPAAAVAQEAPIAKPKPVRPRPRLRKPQR